MRNPGIIELLRFEKTSKISESNCNAWEGAEINCVVIACVSQNLMVTIPVDSITHDLFAMTQLFRFLEEINWPLIKRDFIFVSTHQLHRKSE